MSEKSAQAEIVIENPAPRFDLRIELEILDTKDQIRASKTQDLRIEKGKKTYKIPLVWNDLTKDFDERIDWFRFHYKIGEKEGFVSLSELIKDIFVIRVAAAKQVFPGETQTVRVRAVHPVTDLPVKNVRIDGVIEMEIDTEAEDDEVNVKAKAETDSEGFAVLNFKIPENIKIEDADLEIEGRKNGIFRSVSEDFDNDSGKGRVLLTTDKPIYQPGQEFKVRGLYFDANNTVVTNSELEFKIYDQEDTVLFKETVKTSEFGIASVSWKIPDNAKLGNYRVEIDAENDLSEDNLSFKVSRYDLPNFAVTAKPDKTFYLPNDKQAEIAVTADYLFGKPVIKGKVRVVQENERSWNWRLQKYDVTEKGVFEGDADKDGKYIAKVDLEDEFADLLDDRWRNFEDLHFAAYYTDLTTNRTEQKRFDVRISKEPIHIYFIGKTYELSQKLPISAYVSTFYADGSPAVCDVEIKGKNDDDAEFKILQRLKTNSFGAGKLFFERPAFESASDDLDLQIVARDKNGQKGTYRREIEYYDDTEGLSIEIEKTIFKPGESVKIDIVSSKKEGYVYVDVVKDWTVLESFLVKLANGKANLKIPYHPTFKGELTVGVYKDEDTDYYSPEVRASRGIIFPAQENLRVDAKFEKSVYKPNEDGTINFSSLDGAGKPIETALGVVIFDKAVEERARTDAEFGSYFSRYSYFLGYHKSFGGVSLKDLNGLNLSKNISPELQLVAEVMLSNNYFYPRIYQSWLNHTEAKSLYAEFFKKQFTPIEEMLKKHFEKTGENPIDESSLREILRKNGFDLDKIRDVWGNIYRPVFTTDRTQNILTWKTSGADETFGTQDDFDISTSSFSYFQPIGKSIDKAAENYYQQTGKYIRDIETLRTELAKQNIDLGKLKDRWNRDYEIYFEVSGANYVIRFFSLGVNGVREPNYWNRDDFDIWKTSQNYFYKTEQKIVEILNQNVNNGKRPFPKDAGEFQNLLRENDFALENIKDGYGRNVFLTSNRYSRYADKTVIENGKQKITPVTEEVINFSLYTKGADGVLSSDDSVLAMFSGIVMEQSKESDFRKTEVKTIGFAGEQGAIRGTVSDLQGAAVFGASVKATNASDSTKIYNANTDEQGNFVIANLPAAKYDLRIDASGFKSFVYQSLEVKAQNIIEIKAMLEVGGVSEVVNVTGSVDEYAVNASTSTNVTIEQIQQLPVNGRSFSSILKLAPTKPEAMAGRSKDDETDDSPNSTPRLREYFPETLLWNPEVITDKNGKAEVKFKLADNITTWKLYTIASTKKGKIGVTEKEIQAFQPFFVDLEPPKFLTEGDEIHLPTQVRNYTEAKQKVNVSMTKSDWFSFLSSEKQQVEVASGASENAIFGFKAVSAIKDGKQKVTAIAARDSDAIEKPVTVRPNGQEIVKTETRLFTNPATFDVNFPANARSKTQKAELKIYPNLMAHVTESVEGLLQRPYGCGEQTISSTYPNLMILKFTRSDSKLRQTAQKFLQKGYERLIGYQVASGGFSYWGGKDEADIALTAYALRFLNDAGAYITVDPEAVTKAQNWLILQQRADGGFTKKYYWETAEDTNRTKIFTSYVARTLARIKAERKDSDNLQTAALDKALDYLKRQNARIDEPYALALYGLSLLDAGKTEEANSVAEILTKMAIPENNSVYWKLETNTPFYGWGTAGRVETTALVVQFLIKMQKVSENEQRAKSNELITKGTLFLLKNKDRYGVWYSTQTTINVLDAFLAALSDEKQTAENQQIQIALNGANLQTITVSPDQIAPVTVSLNEKLNPNENRLEISSSTNSAVMAQVVQNHYIEWKDAEISGQNTNNLRQLQLDYKCDKQNVQIMEEVNCSVKAERVGFKGYGMLLAEIGIPPGADVSRESLQAAMDADWSLSRYDVLPDRIIIYMWSKAGGTNVTFKFKPRYGINAQTPSSFVYDYYNEEAKATLAPLKFEVK
ncbi:MAG: MG2 domain-containing protein [Pyrinomonadaceae bacterium]|nr:MG2 domain-containing protein [Pyrinomonadaceae bacterium]